MKTENEIVTDRVASLQEVLSRKEIVINAMFIEIQSKESEARRFERRAVEAERDLETLQKLAEDRRVVSLGLLDDIAAYRLWMSRVRDLFVELRSEDLTAPVRKLINDVAEELFPSYVAVQAPNGDNNGSA